MSYNELDFYYITHFVWQVILMQLPQYYSRRDGTLLLCGLEGGGREGCGSGAKPHCQLPHPQPRWRATPEAHTTYSTVVLTVLMAHDIQDIMENIFNFSCNWAKNSRAKADHTVPLLTLIPATHPDREDLEEEEGALEGLRSLGDDDDTVCTEEFTKINHTEALRWGRKVQRCQICLLKRGSM